MYVFDIDGTLADCEHRLSHILQTKPADWDTFNQSHLIDRDKPIYPIITILNALYDKDEHIVLLTGRRCTTRHDTALWMSKHFVQYHALLMRPTGDHRKDHIIKMELLTAYMDTLPTEQRYIDTFFEDRRSAVHHFRSLGFHVCHVADGDF